MRDAGATLIVAYLPTVRFLQSALFSERVMPLSGKRRKFRVY